MLTTLAAECVPSLQDVEITMARKICRSERYPLFSQKSRRSLPPAPKNAADLCTCVQPRGRLFGLWRHGLR